MFHNRLVLLVAAILVAAVGAASANPGFRIDLVEANPAAGFHYPYLLRVPDRIRKEGAVALLVESNNSGELHDDPLVHLAAARTFISGRGVGPYVAAELSLPLLVPAFPRPESNQTLYTHALDRDALLIKEGPLERLDMQLLRMVEDAQARLKANGVDVHEKFLMCGFSASGTFANRFAFLHPDRLLGVAAGAVNGMPMLPAAAHNGKELDYPLGTRDLERITSRSFNRAAWRALPQFIFMGALDENDTAPYKDAFSDEEREIIYSAIGRNMQPDRWHTAQRIYLEHNSSASFVTYGAVGHWTDRRINDDVVNFFSAVLRSVEK
jgi:dienelactone hydrolase